jgi:hypothetical protein
VPLSHLARGWDSGTVPDAQFGAISPRVRPS